MSVRIRLALIFALGAALVIGVGGLVFTHELSAGLTGSLVAGLRSRADTVAQNLGGSAGPNVQDPGGGQPGPAAGLAGQSDSLTQVIGPNGAVLDAFGPGTAKPLLSRGELASARRAELVLQRSPARGDAPMLLLAMPAGDARGTVVITGISLTTVDQARSRVEAALLIGGPLAVALAGLGAWLLAGAALAPVERMRRQAAKISGQDADTVLSVPGTGDELAALARTLNDMLGRLHRALSRQRGFLAVAGHELRTPLAVLKGEVELALSPGRSRADLLAALREAAGETDRLIKLAEDLLTLAAADEGTSLVRLRRCDLAAVIAAAVAAWADPARKKGVELRLASPARLAAVADSDRLRQVIDNLFDNALRFAPSRSAIEVTLRPEGGAVVLEVADEGPGFPPGFLPVAFERFSRPEDHRDEHQGSGLGLAIVKTLVEAHGGQVMAANRPGGGALIRVVLPAAANVS
jgi:two-component system, OmpR family, sensor kinase